MLHEEGALLQRIREGRFQRALAVITGLASLLSGGEVLYEHYRGSYSQPVMYTPILLSGLLGVVGFASAVSRRVARSVLPVISVLVMVDGVIGFVFHVRGVARKPGGWRTPVMNLIMGPPVFAPLLFGLSGYLGLITSFLRQAHEAEGSRDMIGRIGISRPRGMARLVPASVGHEGVVMAHHIREGQFQRNIAAVAGISAIFSGIEASYSHYQNDFQYRTVQTSPLVISGALGIAGIASVWSRRTARTALPVLSLIALADGMAGSFFHLRGILRRPGGLKLPLYNLIYGPPIFAPMLFAASGFLGLLASLLRRPH